MGDDPLRPSTPATGFLSPGFERDRPGKQPNAQAILFAGWTVGVPALAAGMFRESAVLVAAGGWALFVGVAVATVDNVSIIFHGRQSD